jgi:hypothetical protein
MAQHTITATVGIPLAAMAGGPLAQVFGELTLVEAIMGLGGGVTMAVGSRETLRETVRGGFLGSVLAVGFGALAPVIVSKFLGVSSSEQIVGPQATAAYSYAIGLGQHLIIDKISRKKGGDDGSKGKG